MEQKGFTLLETLVALVILATGMVAILLLFPVTLDRQRINTQRTITTAHAQSELAKIQAVGTSGNFQQWLEENRFQAVHESDLANPFIQATVVSWQPMGEVNLGFYRVTLGLRLKDDSVEYFTTYVTDR
ncbi:MAG: type II secretion system protein [Candidatus Hydrogenedens sp.]|nr:type II secretion system protein [Candidatus Hydrogenedens sp.]